MTLLESSLSHNAHQRVLGRLRLGSLLVARGVLTEADLNHAIRHQAATGCRLGEALLSLKLCPDAEIARALAQQLEAPYVDLLETPPLPNLIGLISRELAMEYGVLPVRMEGHRLLVVALDPSDIRVDEAVRQWTGLPVVVGAAPDGQLRAQLHHCYGLASFEEGGTTLLHAAAESSVEDDSDVTVEKLIAAGEEITASQIINTLVADAVRRGASDIHFEPQDSLVRVRYRVDGELVPVVTFSRRVLPSVAARGKVMCGIDLSECRKPQDGGTRVRVDGRQIELRLSTLPGIHGEILVFRALTRDTSLQRLDALGFDAEMHEDFRRVLTDPNGMILVTGPTGSGKTTTLYAALNFLNSDAVNVITVEDPVEVKLLGVNQVQVDDRAGRTFSTTLRAMLRQDPDIIMVGEIRDTETAEIACRAALTGHLVLSSLHTRHAMGTLARLYDMGIPRFTLGASLSGILAQRLVRKVCEHCAADHEPPLMMRQALQERFGNLEGARFRRGEGCHHCRNSGVRGRLGIYELLLMDEKIRRMLAEGQPRSEVKRYAAERGFRSLEQDAFVKSFHGLIPPDEVMKVASWALDEEPD